MINDSMISPKEQKELLLNMLLYIDSICRKNNIKYSLIGGTLIGAIRHKGFIPWDDDIDIILDKDNYKKMVLAIKNDKNDNYELFLPNETKNYPLQFAKLIDKKTIVNETAMIDKIDNYGLFLDIFVYNYVPNDLNKINDYYKKCNYYRNSLVRVKLNAHNISFFRKIRRLLKNLYLTIFGYKHNLKKILQLFDTYNETPTNYVISNNPVYGLKKELQKSIDVKEYIDVDFEGHKVMAFKNYDNILRRTYGNYMELPPEDKRVTHNLEVYWKNTKI